MDYLFSTGAYGQREQIPRPHLILLDLKIPKLDGLQVLRLLRRARGHDTYFPPPVVVLTSSDEKDDIAEACYLSANSYIRKLIDFSKFNEIIQRLAEYWMNVNQPPPFDRKSKVARAFQLLMAA